MKLNKIILETNKLKKLAAFYNSGMGLKVNAQKDTVTKYQQKKMFIKL